MDQIESDGITDYSEKMATKHIRLLIPQKPKYSICVHHPNHDIHFG